MRYFLLMIVAVALVGCKEIAVDVIDQVIINEKLKRAEAKRQSAIVEKEIRIVLKKPAGALTEADYEKVKELRLGGNGLTNMKGLEKLTQLKKLILTGNKLTDVKGLEKLTRLKVLSLYENPDLTKGQIDELQKTLPKCKIHHDFEK